MPEALAEKIDRLRSAAEASLEQLRSAPGADRAGPKRLVGELRDIRQFDLMGQLAEILSRLDPDDARNRRLYAQYLVETGDVTAAIEVLQALIARLPPGHPEIAEAKGLLGRSNKQIFVELPDKTSGAASMALHRAIAAYREPYEADRDNTWHGINLVALLTLAKKLDVPLGNGLDPHAIAGEIVDTLKSRTVAKRDAWHFLTLAEAYLGLGQWDDVERAIGSHINSSNDQAFLCASALRQVRQVWNAEADPRGREIVAVLRARVLELEGYDLTINPHQLRELQAIRPEKSTLEAILGTDGAQTYRFLQSGMTRALGVASIRLVLGNRVGTGFLVRAGDFGLATSEDELLVLTNWHVVNADGRSPGIRPDVAEVVFEAADPSKVYTVREIVWASPVQYHDAAFLRLDRPPAGIAPLPIAKALPTVEDRTRVYVIGYPGGRELSMSLQDNRLLDHDGPPDGKPRPADICRVHYRAPTEPGSSGSPVFDDLNWQVIALHRAGSKNPIATLNEKGGTYLANEGMAIISIQHGIAVRPAGFA